MDESLEVGERIVDLETSSGTMGPRSRRFISSEDDASDHELLTKMFGVLASALKTGWPASTLTPLT